MARNEEKAQSMLHRYLRSRDGDGAGEGDMKKKNRRPYLAILCEDVDEAEKWRRQVLNDISRKVSDIQNPGLGEARTRELNDEINKHIREKRHWERRIRELGGHDYSKDTDARIMTDSAVSRKGYFYFGAARDLPGVAALLETRQGQRKVYAEHAEQSEDELDNMTVNQLLQKIDPRSYYGYDDTELREVEEAREKRNQRAHSAQRSKALAEPNQTHPAWDRTWEQYVGMLPLTGKELEDALADVLLERQKRELCDQVDVVLMSNEH